MSRTVYLGKTKSGKTHLMLEHMKEWIALNKNKKVLEIILLSPTASKQPKMFFLKPYVIFQRDELNEMVSAEVADACEENWYYNNKKTKGKKRKEKVLFIIIDDLGENSFQKNARKNNAFKQLATNMAHFKTCHLLWLLQRMTQATTILRDNVDFVFAFKIKNIDQRKMFWKEFCGDLSEMDFKRLALKAWSQKYGYIFINNIDPNNITYYAKKEKFIINKSGMM